MSVTVSLRGGKEARALLDQLSGRELQNRTKRATRGGAAIMRKEVRAQAKSRSDIPDSFAKTATRAHQTHGIGVSTGPTSPLLNIFEVGAGVHQIGAPGQLLHSGQGEAFFAARGPVRHPGMDARPLIEPVFNATQDEASDKAMDILLEGIR